MALFKKKENKTEIPSLPELPQLPKLPEFPEIKEDSDEIVSQLPTFPTTFVGSKFSQNTIKEAITGKKEEEEVEADEFGENRTQRMQRPLVREEIPEEESEEIPERKVYPRIQRAVRVEEEEPIFIRIDKFEEGSQIFEEVKKKVAAVEKMFGDIKKIKEEEEKELEFWEGEIMKIKEKIEKIDKNIFSKIG